MGEQNRQVDRWNQPMAEEVEEMVMEKLCKTDGDIDVTIVRPEHQ